MKSYKIFLDDIFIGTTHFEFADVPMGVVYGRVIFEINNPYYFLKNFYLEKKADFEFDNETKFLDSPIQNFIKVIDNDHEIKGWGAFLSGIEEDYEITFGGIDSELMKADFPHHFNEYFKETFNSTSNIKHLTSNKMKFFNKYPEDKVIKCFRQVCIAEAISCFLLYCIAMVWKRYDEEGLLPTIFIIIVGNIHGLFFTLYLLLCLPARKIFNWDDEDFVYALLSSLFPFATIWVDKKLAQFDRE